MKASACKGIPRRSMKTTQCVDCGAYVSYRTTQPKYCSPCSARRNRVKLDLADVKPVQARPGYCTRCGVIRLASGDTERCHDCEIEYQIALVRR